MASQNINTLTSFSGADLVVSFANQVIGELQQISWAVQREKSPIFTLGSPDARSFSRGKRGIAGSLVLAVFDHDSLVTAMQRVWDKIAPPAMFTAAGNIALRQSDTFSDYLNLLKWNVTLKDSTQADIMKWDAIASDQIADVFGPNYGFAGRTAVQATKMEGSNGAPIDTDKDNFIDSFAKGEDIYVPAGFSPIRGENIIYADTLPPFDITLTFGNEYGQCAFQKIYDVDILNEGSGVSVDTVVMERQMTYIARKISPLIRGIYNREEGGRLRGTLPTTR